jgi:hypothetical protein
MDSILDEWLNGKEEDGDGKWVKST